MRNSKTNSPVRSTLIRLSVLVVFCSMIASRSARAESPVVDIFNEWLSAFNSGDESNLSGFWQKYGSNQLPPDRFALDMRLRNATGGMDIFRIVEQTPTHLAVVMKGHRGIFSESIMDLTSGTSPVVSRLIGRPVPAPESCPSPAKNDADLITKVREHVGQKRGMDAFSGAVLIAHRRHRRHICSRGRSTPFGTAHAC